LLFIGGTKTKTMKKIFLFIIICALSANYIHSQNPDTLSIDIRNDSVLKKIFNFLPEGWKVSESNNKLIFEKIDSVLILNEDRYNDKNKKLSKAEKIERIKKNGVKGKSMIVFNYEKKWTTEMLMVSKSTNSYINNELKKLPAKYNISNLYNKSLSTRNKIVYTGKTQKEKEQIAKFEKEKNELLTKIVVLPNYNTENFSFFNESMIGFNDNTHLIYPDETSSQLFQIKILFIEYAGQ